MMELAFSTLGCPEWSLEKIIDRAAEYGYDGVELRGLRGEFALPNCSEFMPGKRAEVNRSFQQKHLKVVCVSTSCRLNVLTAEDRKKNLAEVKSNLQLAVDLGSKYIRVFGGNIPEGKTDEEYMEIVTLNLEQIVKEGEKYNVYVLVETHDDLSSGKRLGKIMDRVNHPFAGVVWDINHPYRKGENIEDTFAYLGKYVKHMHLKDTKLLPDGSLRSVFIGKGNLPVERILHILKENNYSGYLSYEWEKAWERTLEEPEIALPDFIQKLKAFKTSLED